VRTIQEVLAELRQLAASADPAAAQRRQTLAAEAARLGYQPTGLQQQPDQNMVVEAATLALQTLMQNTRQGSIFAGPGASREAAEELAARQTQRLGWPSDVRVSEPGNGAHAQRGARTLAGAMQKALAEGTPSAGGVLVPVEVSSSILELIRARVAVMRLGPTIVPVHKELDLPSISTGSAAFYVDENARIPVSEPTFALVPKLLPKELAALVPVANRLLRDAQTNPTIDEALKRDMSDALATRQDLSFLQGLGGSEPLGVRNQLGLTPAPDLGANGRTPTFDDFKGMAHGLRAQNAPFARPGWIFSPRTLQTLDTLKDGQGRYLGETGLLSYDGSGSGGKLLGFPFVTTTAIPNTLTKGTSNDASYVIFSSDWNEAWVGENLGLTLEASGEATYSPDGGVTHISAWQQRQTVFRALAAHDFALRRPGFFTVMEGVRP
jgi:HK97 family phage major capsid protein